MRRAFLSELLGAEPMSYWSMWTSPSLAVWSPCDLDDPAACATCHRAATALGSDPACGAMPSTRAAPSPFGRLLGDFGELAIAAGADVL
ncbi:MAG: hypothetical protein ACLU37_06005 [Collinsella sp.]